MPVRRSDLVGLSSQAIYSRGLSYVAEKRVRIVKNEDNEIDALVQGGNQEPYHVRMRLSRGGDRLTSCVCDCPAFSDRYTPICKHIVAAILVAQEKKEDNAIKRTDNGAAQMLNRYLRTVVDRSTENHRGQAVLEPVLEYDSELCPSLFFRVGEKRMYVVPDLTMFAIHLNSRDVAAYGKYELRHDPASFCAESRGLLAFFQKRYDPNSRIFSSSNAYRYINPGQLKRNMPLTPLAADELFALLEGKKLTVRDAEKQTASVPVLRQDFRPSLRLNKLDGGAALEIANWHLPIPGDRSLHVLTRDCVYSCSEAFTAACGDLLDALHRQRGRLVFAEKELGPLFSVVLSQVESYINLETEGAFEAYHPLPMEAKIYLDTPGPGSITAHMTFTYGDRVHNAFLKKRDTASRDLVAEVVAENTLLNYFAEGIYENGVLRIEDNPDAVYRLATEGLEALAQIGEIYASDAFNKIKIQPPAGVTVGVRVDAGLLHVEFDLEGLDLSELPGILASYRARRKYHLLRDGSFLPLQGTALSGLSDLAEGLDLTDKQLVSGKASLASSRALYLDAICKQNEALRVDRDRAFKRILRDMKEVENADFPVPDALHRVLRNYQKTGFQWLKTIAACGFGGILADDMGLGKTVQVLALLTSYREEAADAAPTEGIRPSIVVCPSSLCLNWEAEVKRFTPTLCATVVTGTAAERAKQIAGAHGCDLLITSYDLLKRDIERYEGIRFAYVILDEAQFIKNQTTQNAKAVKALSGAYRFALTGTPVENSLAELWSIFDFLMPGYLFSYNRFKKRYEEPIVKNGSTEAAERLRQLVRPFLLRRLKKEVLRELPPKTETTLRFEMEPAQKKLYLAMQANVQKELRERLGLDGQDRIAILAALTRLRQICCDPSLLYEDYREGSAKLEGCMELIHSCIAAGRRMLLFSQFTSMLDILQQKLEAIGVYPSRIDGSTKSAGRLELVNAFNAGTIPVFLISLKAGGTGLNLTGADVVIHFDPWWNLSAQNQATDRAHRIGQKNPVQVYKLIAKDTIEERILALQRKKAELVDAVVLENSDPLARLKSEELLALLEG